MSAETPAPRVKLNDLPLKLKRHIAELCAEQDARLAAWSAALVRQSQDNALVAGGASQLRHKYDHSLGALFQVSKEWSEIVAPLHFETVRFGHEGVTPVFKFQVATRRPQHFQVLDLTGSNAAVVDALFPLLPLFTNISKVVIDAPAAVAVLGEDGIDEAAEDDEVKAYVRSVFRTVLARITHLDAPVGTFHLYKMLVATRSLETLEVDLAVLQTGSLPASGVLGVALLRLSRLRNLSISSSSAGTVSLVQPRQSKRGTPAPLRSLTWSGIALTASNHAFAHFFNPSLRHLTIESPGGSSANTPLAPFADTPFPCLETLTIRGRLRLLSSLIQSISAALFPQLLVFRVDAIRLFPSTLPIPPNHPINDLGALFAPDGKPHPTLRIVEIYHPEQTLTQAREETLVAHFAALSPRLVVVTSPASPAPSRALLEPEAATPAHAAAQADAVRRNVAFLAGWSARLDALEREGADEEVVRRERGELAELLGRVELTRLARGL